MEMLHTNGHCVIYDAHQPLSKISEATRQTLRIDKFLPGFTPKLYCWYVLVVLYSYDNKKCVCVKHIMFKIKFIL
jgi:hypothetical protein